MFRDLFFLTIFFSYTCFAADLTDDQMARNNAFIALNKKIGWPAYKLQSIDAIESMFCRGTTAPSVPNGNICTVRFSTTDKVHKGYALCYAAELESANPDYWESCFSIDIHEPALPGEMAFFGLGKRVGHY